MATSSQREMQRNMQQYEPFEVTLRRWAAQSAQQLRDSYRTQKIFNGSTSRDHEVWSNRKKTILEKGSVDSKGRRRRVRKTVSWGWFDENEYRKQLQARNPQADYWFSTGASFNESAVDVSNLSSDPNRLLIEGEVRFRTTMQMYYAEQGVGANGPRQVRGKGGIKVDREDPFSWRYRYAFGWVPVKGQTHRPSVRQQVYYMRRRMRWLAMHNFGFMLNTWLQVTLTDMLDTGTNTVHLPGGLGMTIHPENK